EFREQFRQLNYNIPEFTEQELAAFPPQLQKLFGNSRTDHFTDEEKHQMIADYYAYCAYGDLLVGKAVDGFVKYSEEQKRPWLVLYVCGDHGWRLGEHGMVSKFSHYDTDLHNPIIVVSSDTTKFPAGKVVEDFTEFVDMAPTFLSAAGIDLSTPEYAYLDGRDLAKTAAGELRPRDYIIAEPTWVTGPRALIRTKDFKFAMKIRPRDKPGINAANAGEDFRWAMNAELKDIEPTLFDLRSDPSEIQNLAFDPQYRTVLDVLRTKLQNIVLGDGRIEVAWEKTPTKNPVHYSNFACGSNDGVLVVPQTLQSNLPTAPHGFRWESIDSLTDEFDGKQLDRSKWHDHNPNWVGRAPGKFMPSSVAVEDGLLRIQLEPLIPADGEFTIAAGTIQAKQRALYGYYECRMKASQLSASSNFWFVSDDIKLNGGSLKQELIAQFTIGKSDQHKDFMKSTAMSAYKSKDAGTQRRKTKVTDQVKLASSVADDFHTYGLWWVDANTLVFYADGKHAYTLHPSKKFDARPFRHPLSMTFVCETYDWQPIPTARELVDEAKNTALIDYVRSYRLVKSEP
ncbi:MAG TPA: hypothetical protein DDW52_05155, partial [Planctomycetaceae bacterium]|nr:hypothetical protein [Planctomycetaceae bacterium]